MTIQNLITLLEAHGWAIGIVLVILGSIKLPSIEIRVIPYLLKKLFRGFGKLINGDIISRVETLEQGFITCSTDMRNELKDYIQRAEKEHMDRTRSRILRFNDEVMIGMDHSKEHFDEILQDIDRYEKYCESHTNYENNKAVLAIQTIKEEYAYCLKHNGFLVYTKK